MSQRHFASLSAALLIVACLRPAVGAPISVTNYNWLQLPVASITASAGGVSTGGTGGNGQPLNFRVGDPQWIPGSAFTGSGTGDYWAQITLDTPRNVTGVTLDWWATAASSLSKFTVQGSVDGTTFSDISALTSFSATTDHRVVAPTITTPGTYKAVRVLVKAGDYTYDTANGGRALGLEGFDVRGSGTVEDSQVNWANQPTFGTAASNRGFPVTNGTRYIDGNLFDDDSNTGRTGSVTGHWVTQTASPTNYDYAQIDLGAVRAPKQIALVWDFTHLANNVGAVNGVDFLYSLDGINFFTLPQIGSPVSSGDVGGYVLYNVQQIPWEYLRITDATGNDGLQLLNQAMVFGVPEPTSLGLIALGGLFLVRRNRHYNV